MAPMTYDGVGKVYAGETRALEDFDLAVDEGEFMVLVGPSGCGKTTALRMAAGLEEITEGTISIGDRVVNGVEPAERDIAMVFQNYALYPHMTVFENMAFGLETRRLGKRQIREKVEQIAGVLGLGELLKRKPAALSGGQRQRVAMGRAIVREPQLFLMDEPLSNLDAKLRVQMRAEIARIQREVGTTTLYVTHDQVEAMTMGDRVAVLQRGRLQQLDRPQTLYDAPANLFVASFIGSPPMNLLRARLVRGDAGLACLVGDQRLPLPEPVLRERPELARHLDGELALGFRPESVGDPAQLPDAPRLRAVVKVTEALGAERLVHLEVAAPPVVTTDVLDVARDVDAAAGEDLRQSAEQGRATVVARFPARADLALGAARDVAVDTEALHFFDLETGRAL